MRKLLIATLLAPLSLAAQMKLFVVDQSNEVAIGDFYPIGTVAAGNSIDTTFRVRNDSSASASLYGLNVAGYRFSFASLPTLPLDVPAGEAVEFVVRFQPETPGSYSAYLNINGSRLTILQGTAIAGIVLSLEQGTSRSVLSSGVTVDFGSTDLGSSSVRRFVLSNPAEQALGVQNLAVDGVAFRGPIGLQAPVTLKPGESMTFEIAFEPLAAGVAQGTLQFDQRRFALRGFAKDPVSPKPQIVIDPAPMIGGQQSKVSIRLESPSQSSGGGELSMQFTAGVSGKGNDPAVLFPATGTRSVPFSVTAGQDKAVFGATAETVFQTGTTAGTIVFTARLGSHSVQTTVVIPPAPVTIDEVRVMRAAESLEVNVTGFDTSRSASMIAFTFFDKTGTAVSPGAIHVDAGAAFHQYFESTDFGSLFTLRAVFPVTGNGLQITAVEVELTNSQGASRYPRVAVP